MNNSVEELTICIANIKLRLSLEYAAAAEYFRPYVCLESGGEPLLTLTEEDWNDLFKHGFKKSAQSEASFLTAKCSDALLQSSRCIIHAVAFRHKESAYLIAAASGVGKSTQVKTLMDLYPGEISVICGDRPALELMENGVMVHPTPWNGKENWKGAEAAFLKGILFLRRGNHSALRKLTAREAVIPLWQALIQTWKTEDSIRRTARFTEELLVRVPCWEYINSGVPDSARFLYQELLGRDVI